jgi:hypothetical protein
VRNGSNDDPHLFRNCSDHDGILALQGYLAHKKQSAPPWNHDKTLGIVLLQSLRREVFLIIEVPLYLFHLEGRSLELVSCVMT